MLTNTLSSTRRYAARNKVAALLGGALFALAGMSGCANKNAEAPSAAPPLGAATSPTGPPGPAADKGGSGQQLPPPSANLNAQDKAIYNERANEVKNGPP